MVGSVLKGGLGNMMFQIAAAEAVAVEINADAIFYPLTSGIIHRQPDAYINNIFRNVKFDQDPVYLNTYAEPRFSYSELPKYDHFLYDGYFQSEMYFSEYSDHIKNMFGPTPDFIDETLKRYPDILTSCGIHVRRGDFLKFPDIHPVLSPSYFSKGFDTINEISKDVSKTYVFTNDLDWCVNNLLIDNVEFISNDNDWEDLWMMSMCKHYVISNSTFSWWGAWLGASSNSIIIAPDTWFGPRGYQDTQDLYCKDWIRIKN